MGDHSHPGGDRRGWCQADHSELDVVSDLRAGTEGTWSRDAVRKQRAQTLGRTEAPLWLWVFPAQEECTSVYVCDFSFKGWFCLINMCPQGWF